MADEQFDPSTLGEDQQAGFQAYLQGRIDNEVKGLKAKNGELLGQVKTTGQTLTELQTQVSSLQEVVGDRDPDKVKATLSALDKGEYLDAIDKKDFDRAFGMRLDAELKAKRSEWERDNAPDRDRLSELERSNEALTGRVRSFSISDRVTRAFDDLPDAKPGGGVREDVKSLALSVFSLDEAGEPVILDEFGEPKEDARGNRITPEAWVESLRDTRSHYFADPVGAGAKGGRATSNGFGTGITTKKGATPETRSKFMTAARAAGKKAPLDEWNKLPDD